MIFHFTGNSAGGGSGGINSEYVRKELRTVVDARMQQQQQRVPNNMQNNLSGPTQEEFEALGLSFDMTTAGMPKHF